MTFSFDMDAFDESYTPPPRAVAPAGIYKAVVVGAKTRWNKAEDNLGIMIQLKLLEPADKATEGGILKAFSTVEAFTAAEVKLYDFVWPPKSDGTAPPKDRTAFFQRKLFNYGIPKDLLTRWGIDEAEVVAAKMNGAVVEVDARVEPGVVDRGFGESEASSNLRTHAVRRA